MSLSVSTAEILVSDLPTKSVTLTPLRATVVREIQTTIQPGQNEITILGLDPQVDPDSIRVDGSGSATITDIQTDKVPRREKFEDVYPEESDNELSDVLETDSDEDFGIDDSELEAVRKEIAEVEAALAKARGNQSMSLAVSNIMEGYGKNLNMENADASKLNEFLQLYVQQHSVECKRHHESTVEIREAEKSLERLNRKRTRLETSYNKAKEAALKDARKERKKRLREREEKKKKQQQLRNERKRFWTHVVSQVVVHLDSQSMMSPGSSRRSSIVEKAGSSTDVIDVTLRLTYVIPGPRWVSRYDLRISTPSSSTRLTYRAEFHNSCSETWRDTQVTLSTSQASFSGLDERIPQLQGWHIKLDPNNAGQPSWNNILRSLDEPGQPLQAHAKLLKQQFAEMQKANQQRLNNVPQAQMQAPQFAPGALFGPPRSAAPTALFGSSNAEQQMQTQQQTMIERVTERGERLDSQPAFGRPAFGMAMSAQRPAAAPFGNSPFNTAGSNTNNEDDDGDDEDDDEDSQTLAAASLEHQDSVKQDYGLTTTYDLPGRRTLVPSSVHRRHVLAELDLKSMTLTHIIVPKIRAAAFLRARIQNTSSVTILRGQAGMTVDGTFLGTTSLPNCAPKDAFNISLGVDPSILVTYAKPSVRRVGGGFFSKEHTAVFRRTCWVKNTKSIAVDLIVSEQVPLSEDDKLRVQILEPKGLEKEGDQAKMALDSLARGTVSLAKNGEVKWMLKLQPGKDIRLTLEYEARVPQGSQVEIVK
ncbi:isoform b of protein F37C4.5 [Aspergillus udagawae]|nr:isoform b of protein F37C4.5 [Aspergillus udagawae]GFG17376.1 isoform b of protein F37C4.5 [Aspergillus udagawae]